MGSALLSTKNCTSRRDCYLEKQRVIPGEGWVCSRSPGRSFRKATSPNSSIPWGCPTGKSVAVWEPASILVLLSLPSLTVAGGAAFSTFSLEVLSRTIPPDHQPSVLT